jgi:serine/threonine protein phosphatase PrpC
MQLEIAVLSRAGGRQTNQDACGFWSGPGVCFCVVADGAGGHRGGDVASKLVVQETLGWFRERHDCSGVAIEAAMRNANEAVVRTQQLNDEIGDMRTTAVVLAVDFEHGLATWGHLGDSRLYCFRDRGIVAQTRDHSVVQSLVEAGGIVAQTRDHSVVQSLVEAGLLDPKDLRTAPDRSKLLAAMGDLDAFEPRVTAEAFSLQDRDKFLLCTDGLWEYVEEAELQSTLDDAASAEEWLRLLEARVLARGRKGQDNYSALAVWCNAEPPQ